LARARYILELVVSSLDNFNSSSLALAELAALKQSPALKEASLKLSGFAKYSKIYLALANPAPPLIY